jgi:Mannosyltransferase (PIG-V)
MSKCKFAWRVAAWAFLLSRGIILGTTWVSLNLFPPPGSGTSLNCAQQLKACLLAWNYWDLYPYIEIAQHGYWLSQNTVFFPLWPLCIRLLGNLLGASAETDAFVALLLANSFCYLALVFFFALAATLFDETTARKSVFCLALYPYAVFLFAGYSESLFLLLSLLSFLLLHSQRLICWWLAGLCAGLATLTRATGLVLLLPFLVIFVQRYFWREQYRSTSWSEKLLAFIPLLFIPLSLGCYMLYLALTWKNPLLFVFAEQAGWSRHSALPWIGLLETLTALLTGYQLFHNLVDLTFTLLPLFILMLGWQRLPLSFSIYALGMILFSLSNPSVSTEPLTSAPRYMLTIFPLFLILGFCCKHPLFERIYNALASILLVFATFFFVHHYWLA